MKKIILLFAGLVPLFVSCYREPDFPPKPTSSIILDNEADAEIVVDESETVKTIHFKSAKAWTASLANDRAEEWCTVSPTSGDGGEVSVTINIAENIEPDERNASVVLKSGVTKRTITITQKQANSILLSSSRQEIAPAGGNFTLTARATASCIAEVAKDSQSWIKILATKSISTSISFSVSPNSELIPREGHIIVKNGDVSETVTIYQLGTEPSIVLSKSVFEFPETGGDFNVDVSSNVSVTLRMPTVAWLHETSTKASSTNTYSFSVDANPTVHERTAEISFVNEDSGISKTVTIRQSGQKGDGSIRILAIGNSFSDDAMEYLYQILTDAGYTSIKLGNLYIGGCPLVTHAENIVSGAKAYTYRVNTDGTWKNTDNYSSVDAIKSDSWDYISLQQASGSSGIPDTYEPYLTTLISKVREYCPGAELMWHMTWAYQANSTHSDFVNYDKDQMKMYNSILSTVQSKVLTKPEISFVIPCGTVIQNLRTSFMGDNLTRDGYHLTTKIGRYAAGLMWAKQITGCDIQSIKWKPEGNIYTSAQIGAIKEAIANAFANPYKITNSTFTVDNEDLNASLQNIIRAAGYNPDDYVQLDLNISTYSYYNSSVNSSLSTNLKSYAATQILTKSQIPVGSLIVQKEGYQYRPEGWVALDQKNEASARPANTSAQVVEVTDEWWGSFNFRGFNLAKTGAPSLDDVGQESLKTAFGIFVPKPVPSNPELENILKSKGFDLSKYKAIKLGITTYAYYNSTANSSIGTNLKNYAATRIFTKSELPNGTLIVQKEGYQYRPEGWVALDQKNEASVRPSNTTIQVVEVNDAWWGSFNFRGFNLAKANAPTLDDAGQESLKTAFGIYVPINQ